MKSVDLSPTEDLRIEVCANKQFFSGTYSYFPNSHPGWDVGKVAMSPNN